MASLILPSPLPDESLYSLVARMTHANGFPSAPQVCARLFGESDVPRVADIPVDLERFCLETDARYGVLAAVRSHLTLAAFHGLLATHASVERYRRIDASDLGTDTPELSLAGMAHGLPFLWRCCGSCMREDERLYGLPYWHRFHHLPGVLVCPRHGDPLHELRIPFRERQQHFIAPSSLMRHAAAPEVSASAQAMLDNLALFANEGLCIDSEGYSPAVFCGAVRDGLTEMGLASKSGTIRAHAFALEFVEHHACLADLEPFAAYIKPEALVRLAKAMSTAALMLPPTLSLMLIRWVFGSWGLYQERCHWNMTMGSEDSPASGSSDDCGPGHKSADAIRTKHRNLCIEFLNANPEATRTDFWHTHPKACHWLHRHDSSWLGQQLLLAHGVQPIQMNLFASSQD